MGVRGLPRHALLHAIGRGLFLTLFPAVPAVFNFSTLDVIQICQIESGFLIHRNGSLFLAGQLDDRRLVLRREPKSLVQVRTQLSQVFGVATARRDLACSADDPETGTFFLFVPLIGVSFP
jgi:hypothetical protein